MGGRAGPSGPLSPLLGTTRAASSPAPPGGEVGAAASHRLTPQDLCRRVPGSARPLKGRQAAPDLGSGQGRRWSCRLTPTHSPVHTTLHPEPTCSITQVLAPPSSPTQTPPLHAPGWEQPVLDLAPARLIESPGEGLTCVVGSALLAGSPPPHPLSAPRGPGLYSGPLRASHWLTPVGPSLQVKVRAVGLAASDILPANWEDVFLKPRLPLPLEVAPCLD